MVAAQPRDEWVFLKGRPPISEYIGFIQQNAADQDQINHQILADEWRAANDHLRQLEVAEAGWADDPTIGELPADVQQLVPQVLGDPMFVNVFQFVPVTIGMVELDRLVVFQNHINVSYTNELRNRLGAHPTNEAIFRLCLPIDHPQPPMSRRRIADNAYVFNSPSMDIRFIESIDIEAAQIAGYSPRGPGNRVIGLVVGYGSNYLNAIRATHASNRLILNNGSHRAYALRDAGVTHVPCIIQQVTRDEELEVTCKNIFDDPPRYLRQARPSVLKDYFDPQLRKTIEVFRAFRQVKIGFGYEISDVPGF